MRSAAASQSTRRRCSRTPGTCGSSRPKHLTEKQRDLLDELLAQPLQTVRAYTLSQQFDSSYELDDPDTAREYLRRWITAARTSELESLAKFCDMLQEDRLGVISWHHSRVSNGLLEALNSLIQAAKRRPRGYRSNRNFIAIIHLIVGKLNAGPVTAWLTLNVEEPGRLVSAAGMRRRGARRAARSPRAGLRGCGRAPGRCLAWRTRRPQARVAEACRHGGAARSGCRSGTR